MTLPRIALLVISDGRDHLLAQTLASFREQARDYELVETISVDDREHDLGFCGALRRGMAAAFTRNGADYVFHLEDDWRFLRPFSVAAMRDVLEAAPDLVQVSLLRGPHGAEGPAGPLGWPDVTPMQTGSVEWLAHAYYYTTNPNLIRRETAEWIATATAPSCEQALGEEMIAAGRGFAVLGNGEPWIEHLGVERTGHGY